MVKHLILWKLKSTLSESEKSAVRLGVKSGLEGLQGRIPGLREISVRTEFLASSNADIMLECTFDDEAALKGYAVHPEHVAVANSKVRPYTELRLCMDYILP